MKKYFVQMGDSEFTINADFMCSESTGQTTLWVEQEDTYKARLVAVFPAEAAVFEDPMNYDSDDDE